MTEKLNHIRILQAMAGASHGGAEIFFERLTIALNDKGVLQQLLIKPDKNRLLRLSSAGLDIKTAPFGGKLDFKTKIIFKDVLENYRPHIVFTWMNRATGFCERSNKYLHVARLGGYYNLKYYKNCDRLIGNTPDIVQYLIKNGWDKNRAHYLPNFVELKADEPISRRSLGIPDGVKILFSLGRLHENKAFEVLIRALKNLPDVYLILAGTGPLEEWLKKLAEIEGVASRIVFTGWIDNPYSFFELCDALVCPSRHEPLGNVIIESWAHSKPVIAAASQGPLQLIKEGENGLLFGIDKIDELTAKIKIILDNDALRQNIAKQGFADYDSNFSKKQVVEKYMNFFKSII